MTLADILAVADAVLYEGYLLYPYRSTSSKNLSRWQFGVLGPPGASTTGLGEDAEMHAECLVQTGMGGELTVYLRFLQLQSRTVERVNPSTGQFERAQELQLGARTFTPWDEAVEQTIKFGPFLFADLHSECELAIEVEGGDAVEEIFDEAIVIGRVIRRRWPLRAVMRLGAAQVTDDVTRLKISLANSLAGTCDNRDQATRASLLGTHLVIQAQDAWFVSLLEPPVELGEQAARCFNHRCWPVLAGKDGSRTSMLVSPIILYDYPAIAPESAGSLFDSTEIDEILTLRVITLTDEEKAAARSTDPAAAAIIDRCEAMTPAELEQLHGVLRSPAGGVNKDQTATASGPDHKAEDAWLPAFFSNALNDYDSEIPIFATTAGGEKVQGPWWNPEVDETVLPATDAVLINGVTVTKGSSVRLHPSRVADAQDLFFANERATVTAVLADVDGRTHVAVVIDGDPAADLHEWYGRYLYFSPEEIEPLDGSVDGTCA